jgi:hypothetical protein
MVASEAALTRRLIAEFRDRVDDILDRSAS